MNAERNLKKYGEVILSPDKKFPVQSPYLAIANKAIEQMLKILIEFGMTPSSRSRVQMTPPSGPSALALYRASRDSNISDSQADPDDLDAFVALKGKIFPDEPKNPAEILLERANRAREGPPPKSGPGISKVGDEDGADQSNSSCD